MHTIESLRDRFRLPAEDTRSPSATGILIAAGMISRGLTADHLADRELCGSVFADAVEGLPKENLDLMEMDAMGLGRVFDCQGYADNASGVAVGIYMMALTETKAA